MLRVRKEHSSLEKIKYDIRILVLFGMCKNFTRIISNNDSLSAPHDANKAGAAYIPMGNAMARIA
jgi:hypothetical protein